MKHTTIIMATMVILSAQTAMADTWVAPVCCTADPNPGLPVGCAETGGGMNCYGTDYINCTSCKSGYSLRTNSQTIRCGAVSTEITYGTCLRDMIIQPVECMAGQYKNGMLCANCPDGGTSVAGATAITQCYKPKYETTFSDSSGNGVTGMANDCYYTE
ncbi:MAG: hypothetical protein K2L94_01330 [Alphaproteobacteria bacterium]|nr:hypothetical protein [Alphaproteobacteria bacterium]